MRRLILLVVLIAPFWGYRYYTQKMTKEEEKESPVAEMQTWLQNKKEQLEEKLSEKDLPFTPKMKVKYKRYHKINVDYFLEFHPDEEHIIASNRYDSPAFFSIETGERVRVLDKIKNVFRVDRKYVFGGSIGGKDGVPINYPFCGVWSLEKDNYLPEIPIPQNEFIINNVSPNGELIVGRYEDQRVKIWSIKEQRFVNEFYTEDILDMCFSNDGKSLLIGKRDGSVSIYTFDGREIETTTLPDNYYNLYRLPGVNGYLLHSYVEVYVLDDNLEIIGEIKENDARDITIKVTGDGRYMVYENRNIERQYLCVYSVESMEKIGVLHEGGRKYYFVNISCNGKYVMAKSSDELLTVWRIDLDY